MALLPFVEDAVSQDYWSSRTYVQFSSPSFPPFIDATSDATQTPSQKFDLVFDRIPLIATPNLGDATAFTQATYAIDRIYTEDSVSFSQMRNNPNSLGTGEIVIRLLDQNNEIIPDELIAKLTFTLLIWKPRPNYP